MTNVITSETNGIPSLLPCPFCGGEAETSAERFERTLLSWVYCKECGAAGGYRHTEAEAIEAWNTRAERTCNLIGDGDSLHCSNCGGAAEKQSWAYWRYCPNCCAKVVGE